MHDYFIRQNQKQTVITFEKEDLEFEAGFKKVNCIIYVYCKPGTNIGVYVGQTMQTLERRAKQHLAGRKQDFDKVYTPKSMFDLKVLEKKTFTMNIQFKSDDTQFIKSYGGWMDEREKYYIKKYNTWKGEHGFNQNEGGQGLDQHVRRAQSVFKRSLNKFRTKYWPAMLTFLKTEKAKLPCGTPSLLMVKRNEKIIGELIISSIRTGHTSVPAFYKKLMLEHGHVDNYSKGMWKQVYWPAMQAFLKTDRAKLPCGTPSLLMVAQNEKIIGELIISSIRTGRTSVPAFYKKLMLEHGHVDNHSEGMWKQVYWPAMQAFLKTEKAKLPCGTPSLLMVGQKEKIIGRLIDSIRTGNTSVSAFYKKMLDEHGMFWSTRNVATHVLRKLGIRRYVSTGKFEIDHTVSLDPAENENIAVCLEKLRCFLLDENINGSRCYMASKKYTSSRETFIEKYRKDLQSIVENE